VPEWGTGKRAKLEGIKTAGKTGTASAYRDAWFVGYTGNFTAAVWMGNDDFSSTRRLTGGVLPASVWHDFMTVAHQGIELKPIPFIDNTEPEGEAVADAGAAATPAPVIQERPDRLSEETATRLRAIEKLMRDAPSLRPVAALWPPSPIGLSVPPPPVFTIPPPRPADAAPVSTNAPAPPASPSFIQ
jgi:penicillin-binding protein 1A